MPKKYVFALLAPEDDNSHEPMSEREEDDDDNILTLLPLVIDQSLIEMVAGNQINGYFLIVIPNYNDYNLNRISGWGMNHWSFCVKS